MSRTTQLTFLHLFIPAPLLQWFHDDQTGNISCRSSYSCTCFYLSYLLFVTCTLQFCCFAFRHFSLCIILESRVDCDWSHRRKEVYSGRLRCRLFHFHLNSVLQIPEHFHDLLSPLALTVCVHFTSRSHWQMRAITVCLVCSTHLSVSLLPFSDIVAYLLFTLMWGIL